MTPRSRIVLAALLGAVLAAAPAARAELTFPVNDNSVPGVFDQPSVAMYGATAHVAFIGASGPSGPFRVYHAVVNGSADFSNLTLTRAGILLSPPAQVFSTAIGNDLYYDARHPVIALRSATEAVIFFQAKPSSAADTAYLLYRALVTFDNNTAVVQSVRQVLNIPPGDVEDVSFALVTTDNTARIAYTTRSQIAPTEPFRVSFARVGLDNATAAAPVEITTASYPSSLGYRPLPSLKLDDLNRAHIAWAATDASGTNPGPVYYAMVRETNGVDNMVIAPSQIMTGGGILRYSFPNLLLYSRSLVTVLAVDALRGDLAYVQVNPDEARQNGLPAWDNLGVNNRFLPVPPGEVVLPPNFRVFRPDMQFEPSSERIFITGYGSGGTNPTGATFRAIKLNAAAYSADIVTGITPFATTEYPATMADDYTKAALGFPGGRALVFWSGIPFQGSPDRNLDVTVVATVPAWVTSNESGCVMVRDPARGASGRMPGALLLFLPAAALAARRLAVRRGPRAAPPAPEADGRPDDGGTIGP